MSIEAMKQALEWIEKQPAEVTASKYDVDSRYAVLKELEEALAKQEQGYKDGYEAGWTTALNEAYSKQEQSEPVAWISQNAGLYHFKPDEWLDPMPLYLTPQQRTWVGLTDEELSILGEKFTHPDEGIDEVDFGMEIQRILKEKNT